MQCQCLHQFGGALRGETRPDPQPQDHEILLEVLAAGVCHTDLHVREGGFDLGRGERLDYATRGVDLPRALGHETVGRVVALGSAVKGVRLGQSYVVYPWCGCGSCPVCARGEEQLCTAPRFLGVHRDGGYASHLMVPDARYLFEIGDLAPEFAAPLACSGLTCFAALRKVEDRAKEQPALLIGAGGLGLMALQLMQAQGFAMPVIADLDLAKRAAALAAGARAAIDPRAPDALAQIEAACGGRAPMAVIDFVGAEASAALGFQAAGKGGILVNVGLFGGAAPWSLPLITLKSLTIQGSYTGSLPEFADLMALARAGAIKPIPTSRHPLTEAEAVLNDLAAGRILGRAILTPAPQ